METNNTVDIMALNGQICTVPLYEPSAWTICLVVVAFLASVAVIAWASEYCAAR